MEPCWAERYVRRVGGYWRKDNTCSNALLEGRYAVYRADQTDCPIAGVTDQYVIDVKRIWFVWTRAALSR